MSDITHILRTIQHFPEGISLTELLNQHPEVSRRTMQRWIKALIAQGDVKGVGQGRARRYQAGKLVLGQLLAAQRQLPAVADGGGGEVGLVDAGVVHRSR